MAEFTELRAEKAVIDEALADEQAKQNAAQSAVDVVAKS